MKTGFYNIKSLTIAKRKAFYKDAVLLSYESHIDVLDCDKSFSRQRYTNRSIQSMIDSIKESTHCVCIDRTVQYDRDNDRNYEVGFSLMDTPDYFLYSYLTKDDFITLVTKYNLKDEH